MAKIGTLLFALFGCLLVSVGAAPTANADVDKRDWIGDIINFLGLGLVTQINAFITLESLTTNLITINFDVHNPLLIELTIDRVVSQAGLNGTVYASFDYTFETPFIIKGTQTANSGTVPNVLLTQGALASLDIIPYGVQDLINVDVYARVATINGKIGIPLPIKGLKQSNVPASSLEAVLGNTEIINFSVADNQALVLPFTSSWPVLDPSTPFTIHNVSSAPLGTKLPQGICATLDNRDSDGNTSSCPHELWIVLDLDQGKWKGFTNFTLRLSWPAYHPTDFHLKIFDPANLVPSFRVSSPGISIPVRRKYARIQAVHSGVLTPGVRLDNASRYTVPVHVILEPLYLGVLPTSVIPMVMAVLGVIAVGLPVSRKINDYLQAIVKDADEEAKRTAAARKKD
ncbi:hypothetical protein NLJ89_g3059 [Agrocybe chaxingu]|uniref:Uncharacterized protein n=1 Tax=Agrocybe chaxingu TaxID=84603 RepID=A0A9W8K4Q9_9AGAR|nr:hypothetical protein NLJ89_g3059 [Agrocybe chaxingu]